MKPFSRSSKAGFTLVELIVVIAILAILAGVAIPVYSGYIEKANQAADLQLLGAVNTSFAASCAEVGISSSDVSGAVLKVTDGCITGVNVSGLKPGVTPMFITASIAPTNGVVALSARPSQPFAMLLSATDAKAVISESFLKYFAGNTTTELKYYDGAGNFAFENGVFVAYDNGTERTISFLYVDKDGITKTGELTVNTNDLNNYLSSTYEAAGSETLTIAIDTLVSSALKNASALFNDNNSPGFNAFFSSLGLTEPDYSEMTAEQKEVAQEEWNKTKANALVLYVASKVEGYNSEALYKQLTENGTLSNAANSVFEASTMYALMTGYVNSGYAETVTTSQTEQVTLPITYNGNNYTTIKEYYMAKYGEWNKDNVSNSTDSDGNRVYTITADYTYNPSAYYADQTASMKSPVNVVEMYRYFYENDSNFLTYMTKQGQTDLEAFVSAMNMINDNTNNIDLQSILSGDFTEGGVAEMLKQLTGN